MRVLEGKVVAEGVKIGIVAESNERPTGLIQMK